MEASRAADALARASAALVGETDVVGSLATLLASGAEVLRVDAGGILVDDGEHLEVLVASSHEAAELELHQSQLDEGPCVDAQHSGEAIDVHGADLMARWPTFGRTMADAGYSAVHASPLRWHGHAIGAMGMFRHLDEPLTPDEGIIAQAFADLASLLIVQNIPVDLDAVRQSVQDALHARIVVEQAKGVLAETQGLDMAAAYAELLSRAAEQGGTLTATARQVIHQVQARFT